MTSHLVRCEIPSAKVTTQLEGIYQPDLKSEYPGLFYVLFMFFVLYITLPLIEIPLLGGLSLSAPIFFFVAIPVLLRPVYPWFSDYWHWILTALIIWVGIFTSAVLNGLFTSGLRVDQDTLTSLIQFAYWFLVFVVTIYLASSQKDLVKRLAGVIAIGVFVLGVLRIGEAILGGAVGGWMHLVIMSENDYAMQFSMFYPIMLPFVFWGSKRKLATCAVLLLLTAIIINGSRTGWVTMLASSLVFLGMYIRTQRQRLPAILIVLLLGGMLWLGALWAPASVVLAFQRRFSTFYNLGEDKSYATRQLMDQKGLKLFQSNPWIGIGISRWQKEFVSLDIPLALRSFSQSDFAHTSSHNAYIQLLAETGLAGAIPFGCLLLFLTIQGFKSASHLALGGQVWALGIYAGFIGMSIHLYTLSGLEGTATWFVYALVAAVIVLDNRAISKEKQSAYAPRLSLSRSRSL